MSFVPKNGTSRFWQLRLFKKTATVALSANSLVDWPASPTGYVVAATSSTTKLAGILQRSVTSSDADYGNNSLVPVLVPLSTMESTVIATAASASATSHTGLRCDLTDAVTVNVSASSVGRFVCTKVLSATSIEGYLLPPALTGAA